MKFKVFSLCLVLAMVLSLVGVAFHPSVALAAAGITLSPSSGKVGDEIDADGTDFASATVYLYFTDESLSVGADWDIDDIDHCEYLDSDTPDDGDCSFSFQVPDETTDGADDPEDVVAGTYYVVAVDDENTGSVLARRSFTVTTGEGKLTVSPTKGLIGSTITVKGSDFDPDETVYLYLTDEDLDEGDDWDIDDIDHCEYVDSDRTEDDGDCSFSFTIPEKTTDGSKDPKDVVSGTYYVVAVDGKTTGEVLAVKTLQVIVPAISLSPTSGTVGSSVTVSGKDFSPSSTVTIYYDGASKGTTTSNSSGGFTFSLTIPASSAGDHVIKARDAKDHEDDATFKVTPSSTVTPTQVNVGTRVTVSGSGFSRSQSLTIKYDGIVVVSGVTTGNDGSFEQSFNIPKSIHGAHTIVASDAGGATSTPATVTMEATPPSVPQLSSPENGSRVGFVGATTPTFEWSAVTDPSGVSYSLQIATTEDFAAPVISLTDLSQNSYTLTEEQALPQGTYYWRVKAIDGAQNDSGWATAYSFNSGLLPLWAFIVIVILVIGLICGLVYFFTRRGKV